MHFFQDIAAESLNETETQIFQVINEMITKINDVQFIGVADIIHLASDAIGKVEADKKEVVRGELKDIRNAVKNLGAKLSAENDIKLRQEFANTVQTDRFYNAMQKIIAQGNSDELNKQGLHEKLNAFRSAQEMYKGFGALSPKDLVLVIQMIQTAIDLIKTFQSVYQKYIDPKNAALLEALKTELIATDQPLLECAVDLLELNKPILQEDSLKDSLLSSFLMVTEVKSEPTDIHQFWTKQVNDILGNNSKNPKLLPMPTLIQSLDDIIPKNPFLPDDAQSATSYSSMTIRDYLQHFVYKTLDEMGKHDEIVDLRQREVIPPMQEEISTFWKSLTSLSWIGNFKLNLGHYFSYYFYGQPETSEKIQHTPPPASLVNYSYNMLQAAMDSVWSRLGYTPEPKHVNERYKEQIAAIKVRQQNRKEKHEALTTQVEAQPVKPEHSQQLGRVQQINKINEEILKKKLTEEYDQAMKKLNKIYHVFSVYLAFNINNVIKPVPHPTPLNITQVLQTKSKILIGVSKRAVDSNLKRDSKNTHEKLAAKQIEKAIPEFVEIEATESRYENLLKETLTLCLDYSKKLIKPASQRVQSINWLFHVIEILNTNSDLIEEEKFKVLLRTLNKVSEEAIKDHYRISLLGQCGFTSSALAKKIDDLLKKNNTPPIIPADETLISKTGVQSYIEFASETIVPSPDYNKQI